MLPSLRKAADEIVETFALNFTAPEKDDEDEERSVPELPANPMRLGCGCLVEKVCGFWTMSVCPTHRCANTK